MQISFLEEQKIWIFFGDDDDGDDDAIITIIKFHNIDQISQLWRSKNDDQSSQ